MSREAIEASERVLKELMERRLDAWDLLVIYLDGIQMGSHHVLAAVGVDSGGKKQVKSRVVCKSERKLLDASVRLPWRAPWARGVRGPGNGARSRPQ